MESLGVVDAGASTGHEKERASFLRAIDFFLPSPSPLSAPSPGIHTNPARGGHMSLIDALLLDPAPLDVYIALRSDNAKGSGTQDDPWSGGVRNTPLFTIDSIAVSGTIPTGFTAVVTTLADHGFKNGDLVLIKGVPCGTHTYDYLSNGKFLNGTFIVSQVTSRTFSYTVTAYPELSDVLNQSKVQYSFYGSPLQVPSSLASPATGLTCQIDPYLFDSVMRKLTSGVTPTPTRVHLGPGVFLTRGFSSLTSAVSWQPAPAMNLVGSGIAQTTLRLVEATLDHQKYFVVGCGDSAIADDFVAEGMSFDCNLSSQVSALINSQAIFVRGSHTRLRRLRAVNFGTRTLDLECFVISSGGGNVALQGAEEPTDCVIEDCIAESPGLRSARESTIICAIKTAAPGFHDSSISRFLAYPQCFTVRNCCVNCEFQTNPISIDVAKIVVAGSVTIVTRGPHGLGGPGASLPVRISGAFDTVNGYGNPFNGTYTATVVDAVTFTYTPDAVSPLPKAESEMWLGRFSSGHVPVVGITGVTPAGSSISMTVSTSTPHFVMVGELCNLDFIVLASGTAPNFNGVWKVTSIVNSRQFVCLRIFDSVVTVISPLFKLNAARMGVPYQAIAIDGTSAGLMEGNFISNCTVGGPYHDTYSTKDFIVRRNHFRGVVIGSYQNLQGQIMPAILGSSLTTAPGQPQIAEFQDISSGVSGTPHGLSVGQGLLISATVSFPTIDFYSGKFVVTEIPSPTSFRYQMAGAPGGAADASPAPSFVALVQVRSAVFEDNIYEIQPTVSDGIQSNAILFFGTLPDDSPVWDPNTFHVFRQIVVRRNVIRYVTFPDGTPLAGNAADGGIAILSCENALVEFNTVDLASPYPIYHRDGCRTVKYFSNRTSAGGLIRGALLTGNRSVLQNEPETLIQDALALALM